MTYKEKYKGIEPKGVMGLTNTSGIAIFDIEYGIDDYIISAFHNGENYTDFRKTKIFSNTIGHYFARYGRKYYLDKFMRTNI